MVDVTKAFDGVGLTEWATESLVAGQSVFIGGDGLVVPALDVVDVTEAIDGVGLVDGIGGCDAQDGVENVLGFDVAIVHVQRRGDGFQESDRLRPIARTGGAGGGLDLLGVLTEPPAGASRVLLLVGRVGVQDVPGSLEPGVQVVVQPLSAGFLFLRGAVGGSGLAGVAEAAVVEAVAVGLTDQELLDLGEADLHLVLGATGHGGEGVSAEVGAGVPGALVDEVAQVGVEGVVGAVESGAFGSVEAGEGGEAVRACQCGEDGGGGGSAQEPGADRAQGQGAAVDAVRELVEAVGVWRDAHLVPDGDAVLRRQRRQCAPYMGAQVEQFLSLIHITALGEPAAGIRGASWVASRALSSRRSTGCRLRNRRQASVRAVRSVGMRSGP